MKTGVNFQEVRVFLKLIVLYFEISDAVVRTSYYKYYHPKEALVANGVLNRAVAIAAGKAFPTGSEDENNLQYVSKKS